MDKGADIVMMLTKNNENTQLKIEKVLDVHPSRPPLCNHNRQQ